MKKSIILSAAVTLLTLTASAQVLDGFTQPTDWRFNTSVSSKEAEEVNANSFVGYRADISKTITSTFVQDWSFKKNTGSSVWLGLDLGAFGLLVRNKLTYPKNISHQLTLSSTLRLGKGWATTAGRYGWNFKAGSRKPTNQILLEKQLYKFIVNSGVKEHDGSLGYVGNIRFLITDTEWLQAKVSTEPFTYSFAMFIHVKSQKRSGKGR